MMQTSGFLASMRIPSMAESVDLPETAHIRGAMSLSICCLLNMIFIIFYLLPPYDVPDGRAPFFFNLSRLARDRMNDIIDRIISSSRCSGGGNCGKPLKILIS